MEGFEGKQSADKPYPTYNNVFDRVSAEQIFSYYVPDVVFNTVQSSPLGDKDSVPSFSVFWSYRRNKYLFKDFRYGWHGDAVDFVQVFFGFSTITEACMQILLDFGIDEFHIHDNLKKQSTISGMKLNIGSIRPRIKVDIKVTIRDWTQADIVFWGQFGITTKWLKYARIFPIKYYYINDYPKLVDDLAYVYVEQKDGIITYKIYQPYAEHGKKWINNNDSSVWELWNMLPAIHDFLIITKSRKDALSVMATMNLPATSLQAEGTIPKEVVMNELKKRFKYIFLLYDNDFDKEVNYGRLYGTKLAELFDLPRIELPEKYGQKDHSDSVKAHGIPMARKILWRVIKQELLKINRENDYKR